MSLVFFNALDPEYSINIVHMEELDPSAVIKFSREAPVDSTSHAQALSAKFTYFHYVSLAE